MGTKSWSLRGVCLRGSSEDTPGDWGYTEGISKWGYQRGIWSILEGTALVASPLSAGARKSSVAASGGRTDGVSTRSVGARSAASESKKALLARPIRWSPRRQPNNDA